MRSSYVIPFLTGISILILLISYTYFSFYKLIWQQSNKQQTNENDMGNFGTLSKMLLQSIDFEVFGKVQGVFFRKFTREKGRELGIKGWVMNTYEGTVIGTIQAAEDPIEEMKNWLKHTGSPLSKIDKCVFKNERHISKEEFSDFFIKGFCKHIQHNFFSMTPRYNNPFVTTGNKKFI